MSDNILTFPQSHMNDTYINLLNSDKYKSKYWKHVCKGVGLVGSFDAVCPRCLKTKER